ncbi:hypothetical protein TTHERM_01034350 (macronuclear) [Tetrahymena thermophila SB210]|uniref:Uncharacterized protein n=1 Tax=Tetrahymena thermophila (strain SB210) TaxID=312017 RepID=Q235J2_TETTS|nr:hypothetical protein TTHERM_01034350 [Tetrahymena thermophila SB210]EAR92209.2 hypothetical protein TTHERM_01034350 [Tetrahymena thermophila SB210]|eukprot:XP_001012454.2 hypothetical protein TTHERM_01034350 [Tetrahymena thermophila SB210]
MVKGIKNVTCKNVSLILMKKDDKVIFQIKKRKGKKEQRLRMIQTEQDKVREAFYNLEYKRYQERSVSGIKKFLNLFYV